jgi:hypothetical protein
MPISDFGLFLPEVVILSRLKAKANDLFRANCLSACEVTSFRKEYQLEERHLNDSLRDNTSASPQSPVAKSRATEDNESKKKQFYEIKPRSVS